MGEIKAASETDSYLRLAIKKYSELFLKSGYVFKGRRDDPIEYVKTRLRLMSYMTDNAFDQLMRETAYDLVKFSNAFWIKTRVDEIPFTHAKGITNSEKPVGGYFRVDPDSMQLQFDENGKLIGYKQVTESMQEKKFDVDDVIHFTFDREPGSEWGTPRWIAALEDIRVLRKIEGDVLSLMYRYAMPMFQAQVGLPQTGMGGTEKEVEDTSRQIEATPSDGMLVTTERVNLKVIGAEGNALDVSPYLNYFENRVFTALNTSQAMMGRGGSKQDADSMEEQIHNAVKDNQQNFAIQFQHAVLTELLLEGGYNPILNEDDIVRLSFNEINLDTKVKTENHVINKYQSNAITFEEMRNELGMDRSGVDESRLYSNLIEQANTLEQIKLNHENAMELACLNAQLTSGSDSTSSSNYVKKNTGNGKTVTTGRQNGLVKNTDSPQNQYGTTSAKVKESAIIDDLTKSIKSNGSNLDEIKKQVTLLMEDTEDAASKDGYAAAYQDIFQKKPSETPALAPKNGAVTQFANENITRYFMDIKKRIGNTTDEEALKTGIASQKYRLDYLRDFVYRKAYWYSYMKACSVHGVTEVSVECKDNSRHKEAHNGKILSTSVFSISDIPGYSSGCQCVLKPILSTDKAKTA